MPDSSHPLQLQNETLRLELRPDLGGAISGLWFDGLPVLRSADAAALGGARDSGCFALVPYSNRLGYRRFRWQGHDYTVAQNFPDTPHALHGVAWQRAWAVAHTEADAAELIYRHEADAHWPFAFEVRQRFELQPDALRSTLVLTNMAPLAMPAGLGWHPYFPKRTRSRLHVEITDRWESDATKLPTRKVAQPGIDGDLAHLDFDHCFEGWRGPARVRDEKLALTLTSSLPYLVVYTPQAADSFCVEPVSHVNNAIHMADPAAHGLRKLQPGEAMDAWMQLQVARV